MPRWGFDMTVDLIRDYLLLLGRELHKRGFHDPAILAELESHLAESVEQGLREGLEPAQARQQALERFGTPRRVAHQFEKESHFMKQKILFACALVLGLLIAYVDSRPTWDDTGITVLALLVGGGIIGLLLQRRPWLYALAFGIWIPLFAIASRHDPMMLIVLIFPFIGVFAGWGLRLASRKLLHSA